MKTAEDYNLAGIHTYEDLLKHLQRGATFGTVTTYRDGTKQYCEVLRADDHYIHWQSFGSSANRATAEELEFIVTKIFKMDLPEFMRAFVWVW